MKHEARSSPRLRRATSPLWIGLLSFCGLALVAPEGAAQPPSVTVYHSTDPAGVDPRPAATPGCDVGAGASGLVNGDFETGSLSPWFQDRVVSGGEDWNVTAADPHSGAFSATNTGNKEIRQDLAVPIPVDSIQELSLWMRHPDGGAGSASFVGFFYSDGSGGVVVNTVGTDWNFFDFTGNLTAGKTLVAFSLFGNSSGDPEFARTDIDDVTLSTGAACVIQGGPNEQLELWIDGGPSFGEEGETLCKMGVGGGSGDQLCGADILFQLSGVGSFTHFIPDTAMDTLVCSPCSFDEELELYLVPGGSQQLRLNIRRGATSPLPGPRHFGTLVVDSTGLVPPAETTVTAFGETAGAALQLRPHASAIDPELVATSDPIPEPGWLLQLSSGLLGLAALRRLRS